MHLTKKKKTFSKILLRLKSTLSQAYLLIAETGDQIRLMKVNAKLGCWRERKTGGPKKKYLGAEGKINIFKRNQTRVEQLNLHHNGGGRKLCTLNQMIPSTRSPVPLLPTSSIKTHGYT